MLSYCGARDSSNNTALMKAAQINYVEGCHLLSSKEAGLLNSDNLSALCIAVMSNNLQAALVLLDFPAERVKINS